MITTQELSQNWGQKDIQVNQGNEIWKTKNHLDTTVTREREKKTRLEIDKYNTEMS